MVFDLSTDDIEGDGAAPEYIIVNQRSTFEVCLKYSRDIIFTKYFNADKHSSSFSITFATTSEAVKFMERIDIAMTYNKSDNPDMFV